jgi:hypothetical protein
MSKTELMRRSEIMILEFREYQIKENTKSHEHIIKKLGEENEFIIVGEDGDNFKAYSISKDGLAFVNGLTIADLAYIVPKTDIELLKDGGGTIWCEYDIPKMYLTMEIIEDIQRLNADS